MKNYPGFWPTEKQLNLLRACLWKDKEAIRCYQSWRQSLHLDPGKLDSQLLATVFDQLDDGSKRLLPLLYINLTNQEFRDEIIDSIRGYHKYVWSKNQLIFHNIKKIAPVLEKANIPHLFVKGVPLSKHYYDKDGIRPMHDIDIIIHESDLEQTIKAFEELGWKDEFTDRAINFKSLVGFSRSMINDKGDQLDVHWRIFKDSFYEEDEINLWEELTEFKIDRLEAYTINPTYQLMHTLIHGMKWNTLPSFRWVCDSITILNKSTINWVQFIQFCEQRKYSLRLYHSLHYLKTQLNADIPSDVLNTIKKIRVSPIERKYYNLLLKRHDPGTFFNLLLRHYQFKLYHANGGLLKEVLIFINHYKANWGVRYIASVPFLVIGQLLGMIKHPYQKMKE